MTTQAPPAPHAPTHRALREVRLWFVVNTAALAGGALVMLAAVRLGWLG